MEKRPGVYRLQNYVTGKFYIGSSKNIYRRYYRHREVLRCGLRGNIRIKEDRDKYGLYSFVFGVIEYCDESVMLDREQYYFELYKPQYNVWKHVYDATDRTYTQEQRDYFKTLTTGPKDLKKHSESLKEAWKRRKEKYTPEELSKKMGDSRRGIKHSEETKKNMSENRKGKKKPDSMKEKTRERRLGTKLINGKFVKVG